MASPLRALIIEDSENDCMLLLSILRRGGYNVDHKRVDTAVALKSTLDDPWDIIISDFSMPAFRGTDALAIVRDRGLDTPFIFLSGTIGEDMAVSAMKAGAQDYVIKGTRERAATQTPPRREKKPSRAQVLLLVIPASERGNYNPETTQEGEEPRLPTIRILSPATSKRKAHANHSSLIANINVQLVTHPSIANAQRADSLSSAAHSLPNIRANAASPDPTTHDHSPAC